MNTWMKTNTLDLAKRRGKLVSPTKVHIMLSPYDVPNAVRSYHDDQDMIVIELRYIKITESRSEYLVEDDGVSFEVGDKTQRIYKIFLEAQKVRQCEVSLSLYQKNIDSALDQFIAHQKSLHMKTTKYFATRSAIRDCAESLMMS